jgi:hypothetical protein
MAREDTPQAKRHGREIVGRRLPDLPGRATGGQASPEDFLNGYPSWPAPHNARYRPVAARARRWNGTCFRKTTRSDCGKDLAVTFIVCASRGGVEITTVRLSAVVAIAKGRTLIDDGWQVYITDPSGTRHDPSEFDKLASTRHPAG